MAHLSSLGFRFNLKKSVLTPSHSITFIGLSGLSHNEGSTNSGQSEGDACMSHFVSLGKLGHIERLPQTIGSDGVSPGGGSPWQAGVFNVGCRDSVWTHEFMHTAAHLSK